MDGNTSPDAGCGRWDRAGVVRRAVRACAGESRDEPPTGLTLASRSLPLDADPLKWVGDGVAWRADTLVVGVSRSCLGRGAGVITGDDR